MMKRFKNPIIYAGLSLFVLVFGLIYTANGFGVTSYYMSYAFLPTAVAALFYLALILFKGKQPAGYAAMFFAFFVASATVMAIVKGIFEIAGAYSDYDVSLFLITVLTGAVYFVLYLIQLLTKKEDSTDENG